MARHCIDPMTRANDAANLSVILVAREEGRSACRPPALRVRGRVDRRQRRRVRARFPDDRLHARDIVEGTVARLRGHPKHPTMNLRDDARAMLDHRTTGSGEDVVCGAPRSGAARAASPIARRKLFGRERHDGRAAETGGGRHPKPRMLARTAAGAAME